MDLDLDDLLGADPPKYDTKKASNSQHRSLFIDTTQGFEKETSSERLIVRVPTVKRRRHSCGPRLSLGPPSPRMAGGAELPRNPRRASDIARPAKNISLFQTAELQPNPCIAKREKNISLFHTPRRAMKPWQETKREDTLLELDTIDETGTETGQTIQKSLQSACQEPRRETRQPQRPNQSNIVSQTTIIWQDIHPSANNPKAQVMRKTALATALKIRENRRRTREKEFTARIIRSAKRRQNKSKNFTAKTQRVQKSAIDHKIVEDISPKQSDVRAATKSPTDQIWGRRTRLASITSPTFLSDSFERDRLTPSPKQKSLFTHIAVPNKGSGKTILPSL